MDNQSWRKRGTQIAVVIGLLVISILALKLVEKRLTLLQANTEEEIKAAQATVTAQINLRTTAEAQVQGALGTAVAAQNRQATSEAQVNEILAMVTAQSTTTLPAAVEPQHTEPDQETLAYQLALESQLLLNEQPASLERSMLLAVEAVQRHPSVQTIQVLREGLSLLPQHEYKVEVDFFISDFTYSPDGRYMAAFNLDENLVHVFSAQNGEEVIQLNYENPNRPTFIRDMIFSPDGKYLAGVDGDDWRDNTVILWEVSTGDVIWQHSESSRISPLTFSPDSAHLGFIAGEIAQRRAQIWVVDTNTKLVELPATGSELAFSSDGSSVLIFNNGIYQWDMATEQNVPLFLTDEADSFVGIRFSPQSRHLLRTDNHEIWSLSTGETKPLAPSMTPFDHFDKVVFSPDDRYMATISSSGSLIGRTYGFDLIQVWDVASGQEVFRIEILGYDLAFSPSSQYLAVSFGHFVRILDVRNWKEVSRISTETTTRNIAFSPDGQRLITSGFKGLGSGSAIDMWNFNVPALHRSFEPQEQPRGIGVVQYSPDGQLLAAGGESWIVYLRNPQDNSEVSRLVHNDEVRALDFSPDGRYLLTGAVRLPADFSTVYLWDMQQGSEVYTATHHAIVDNVSFSPDGQYFVTADSLITTTTRVFETVSGEEIISLPDTGFKGAFFSADGQYLCTVSFETAKVWDVTTWQLVMEVEGDLATFSPDSQLLATSGPSLTYNDVVKVWQIGSSQEVLNFPTERWVNDLEFSPDGQYLAMATYQTDTGSLQVWDIINQEKIIATVQDDSAEDVAFSPDSKYIAFSNGAGQTDNLVRVWDVPHKREISRLWHPAYISQVIFSPDGKQLLTISGGTTIHLWQWQPQYLIAEACRRLTRNLTQMEWQTYFGDEPYQPTCLGLSGE